MQFREVKFNGVAYIAPSWEEMGQVVFELARQILEADKKYDRVIALAKGGWTWARTLVDYLGMDELDSLRIKFYKGIGQTLGRPVVTGGSFDKVGGESILIFDDVTDSGKTLFEAQKHLREQGVKYIDTATLFYKPSSEVKPDFIGSETSAWIIFPHEFREFIDETSKKWKESGLSLEEIKERYGKLGLPNEQVEYFTSNL